MAARRRRRSREGSRKGGLATAARMTAEERQERARRAGNSVLRAYGQDYYCALGRMIRSARPKRTEPEAV